MADDLKIPFFDGHNDVLLRLYMGDHSEAETLFLSGDPEGHIDLPRARQGGMVGGIFAIYCPSAGVPIDIRTSTLRDGPYDRPLPAALPFEDARSALLTQAALMLRIAAASAGQVTICRSVPEIRKALAAGSFAVVLHLEGADGIDAELTTLEVLHGAGLRSLGPVWSRPTIFGHGVPMRFPGTPDTGPGLTEAGIRLVQTCNRLGIMIDLAHLNEKGFWDVARLSKAPLVATHSNVHALCPHPRNLLPKQLAAIRDTDGLVGLNLATSFLRPDGEMRADTPMDLVADHIDALIEAVGETRVALGTDFDGCIVPGEIVSVADSPVIFAALRRRGYDDALLQKLAVSNWMRVMELTFG
jgi:membrane dipeptidase